MIPNKSCSARLEEYVDSKLYHFGSTIHKHKKLAGGGFAFITLLTLACLGSSIGIRFYNPIKNFTDGRAFSLITASVGVPLFLVNSGSLFCLRCTTMGRMGMTGQDSSIDEHT